MKNVCGAAIAGMPYSNSLLQTDNRFSWQTLLGTQSCIVRDGFGAGLGQSDRDRKEGRSRQKSNIARQVRGIKHLSVEGVHRICKRFKSRGKRKGANGARHTEDADLYDGMTSGRANVQGAT